MAADQETLLFTIAGHSHSQGPLVSCKGKLKPLIEVSLRPWLEKKSDVTVKSEHSPLGIFPRPALETNLVITNEITHTLHKKVSSP